MLYNNGAPEPIGVVKNPLTHNIFTADNQIGGQIAPPSSSNIITQTGDYVITEDTSDRMITE